MRRHIKPFSTDCDPEGELKDKPGNEYIDWIGDAREVLDEVELQVWFDATNGCDATPDQFSLFLMVFIGGGYVAKFDLVQYITEHCRHKKYWECGRDEEITALRKMIAVCEDLIDEREKVKS